MKLKERYRGEIEQFLKVTARLAANGYVAGDGGNAAWKLQDDLILITPTKMHKGDIGRDDLVFIDRTGGTVEGSRSPTGEISIYKKFFAERPDVVSIIHCHPPCVCALAIMEQSDLAMHPYFPEIVIEIGPVPVVPYAEPVTQKLADSFTPFIRKYNSFIMENHGLLTVGPGDIYSTFLMAELFESSVNSLLKAVTAGTLKRMKRDAVGDLSRVMKARNLPMVGAPGVHDSLESLYFAADSSLSVIEK